MTNMLCCQMLNGEGVQRRTMAHIEVKLESNKNEILKAFREQITIGLETIGQKAEGYAKDNCPVDTGRLRNSIENVVEDTAVYIGTNVEYAPAVEFRDVAHKTGQAHFLRDAATKHIAQYKAIMKAALDT